MVAFSSSPSIPLFFSLSPSLFIPPYRMNDDSSDPASSPSRCERILMNVFTAVTSAPLYVSISFTGYCTVLRCLAVVLGAIFFVNVLLCIDLAVWRCSMLEALLFFPWTVLHLFVEDVALPQAVWSLIDQVFRSIWRYFPKYLFSDWIIRISRPCKLSYGGETNVCLEQST